MTPRARVLSILRGKKPDVVPWFGDLDYLATAKIFHGEKPQDFKASDAYIDWHRELGVGFYLQGYFPFREIIEGCDIRTWKEGNNRYREIRTPKGTLRECWKWLDVSCSEAPVEHLLKSEEDLPAYRFFMEHTRYEADYAFAEKRTAQVKEMGVVLCYLPRSPFMHLLALDAGIEAIAFMQAAAPDEFAETIRVMRATLDKACELAVASPAEILMIPENLSAEMVGPKNFETYMKDYQKTWSDRIKAAGKFSCIHMDGTVAGLLKEESGIGLSFIEALTPQPVGDMDIRDWSKLAGATETIFWGGIPGSYFTPAVSDEEFDRHVKYVLSVMRSEPRYVLGVADQVPPDGTERRVKRVQELVEEYGAY